MLEPKYSVWKSALLTYVTREDENAHIFGARVLATRSFTSSLPPTTTLTFLDCEDTAHAYSLVGHLQCEDAQRCTMLRTLNSYYTVCSEGMFYRRQFFLRFKHCKYRSPSGKLPSTGAVRKRKAILALNMRYRAAKFLLEAPGSCIHFLWQDDRKGTFA